MRSDLDDALVRDFPCLYRGRHGDSSVTRMCDGFPGDGWEPLIRRMSEKLEPFCAATGLHASQVKEKVGALRVYLNPRGPLPDEVRAAIGTSVQDSQRTCEGCGAAGQPRKLRWHRTLCADCATFAAERERRRFGHAPVDDEWRDLLRDEYGRRVEFEEALRRWRSRTGGRR
jgi:hypothetical protein